VGNLKYLQITDDVEEVELVLLAESLRFVVVTSRLLSITMQPPSPLNHQLEARLLLIENDTIRNVEVQAVEYYPYRNQKDDSHPKWKHTDCNQPYLQVVGSVDLDPILEED